MSSADGLRQDGNQFDAGIALQLLCGGQTHSTVGIEQLHAGEHVAQGGAHPVVHRHRFIGFGRRLDRRAAGGVDGLFAVKQKERFAGDQQAVVGHRLKQLHCLGTGRGAELLDGGDLGVGILGGELLHQRRVEGSLHGQCQEAREE